MREISQRTGELVAAGALFTIGLVWVLGSLEMPRGEFSVPGPGFFPMFLSGGLCASALLIALNALRSRVTARVRVGNASIWSTGIALLVVAVLFEPLGFIPAIALFLAFFLRLLSGFRWIPCILTALAAACVVYLFFGVFLGIPLPPVRWL